MPTLVMMLDYGPKVFDVIRLWDLVILQQYNLVVWNSYELLPNYCQCDKCKWVDRKGTKAQSQIKIIWKQCTDLRLGSEGSSYPRRTWTSLGWTLQVSSKPVNANHSIHSWPPQLYTRSTTLTWLQWQKLKMQSRYSRMARMQAWTRSCLNYSAFWQLGNS